jgi:hypothetical protein
LTSQLTSFPLGIYFLRHIQKPVIETARSGVHLVTLSAVRPALAGDVVVVAVVLALVTRQGASLQHPARVLLALTLLGPGGAVTMQKFMKDVREPAKMGATFC